MKPKIVVLLLTHRWDWFVRLKFERLRAEIGDLADVTLLIQKSDAAAKALAQVPGLAESAHIFDHEQLPQELGIPFMNGKSVVPGSGHFPIMAFARGAPQYDLFFVVEFDVEYSGDWGDFVSEVAAAKPDFASLHFRTRREDPRWYWWRSCQPAEADRGWAGNRRNLTRSFNPVYCVSWRGLDLVQAAHRRGWAGHYEILFATILTQRGCRMVDLADLGFCIGREQDPKLYLALAEARRATVRWRPQVTRSEFVRRASKHMLFHPVKGEWLYDGTRIIALKPPDAGG